MDNWGEIRKPRSFRRYGPGPFAPKKKGCGGKKKVASILILFAGSVGAILYGLAKGAIWFVTQFV